MNTPPNEVFAKQRPRFSWFSMLLLIAALGGGAAWWLNNESHSAAHAEPATAVAEKRTFKNVLRRQGFIQPLKEERIFAKLAGTIQDILPEGAMAEKDQVVLKLDAVPHEDLKADQEESMAVHEAEFKKLRVASEKILNSAREDVNSYELRLQLEQLRLDEIKRGPTETDKVNARVNLENNKNLLIAKQEEADVIQYLADHDFASKEEARQKQLEVVEQQLKVVEMDIAQRKLHIIDPVKVAEQQLKVKEATKTRDSAKERVLILENAIARDVARFKLRREREEDLLKDLEANIAKTIYKAPCSGVVVPRFGRYGYRFAPGREVYDGMEVVTIPDLSRMKVKLTVDEGRVGSLQSGMPALVYPAGWTGAPFRGKVAKISEQGRDEFEQFNEATTDISGTANRKVFDVDVELEDHSSVLRLGLRSDVEIVLNQLDNSIVVPRAALSREKDGGVFISIPGKEGAVERRKITVKTESDLWAAVEGVASGERVLLAEKTSE